MPTGTSASCSRRVQPLTRLSSHHLKPAAALLHPRLLGSHPAPPWSGASSPPSPGWWAPGCLCVWPPEEPLPFPAQRVLGGAASAGAAAPGLCPERAVGGGFSTPLGCSAKTAPGADGESHWAAAWLLTDGLWGGRGVLLPPVTVSASDF